jgi:hypothetical protein
MSYSRRNFVTTVAAAVATSTLSNGALCSFIGDDYDPPHCPAPPDGGKPFVAGSDARPILTRKSISALSATEVDQLKLAFGKLCGLPKTDKRRWMSQANLHAAYCNQCDGVVIEIHHTVDFFPWHRAYLYYLERILGSLVNDIDHFRLPTWDWESDRSVPLPYLQPADISNPLWDSLRDSRIARGDPLPGNEGTVNNLRSLYIIPDFQGFLDLCSGSPHDAIHGDVGQKTPTLHDMGDLGYAARDPLFFAHHCRIDKLWSAWNSRAGTLGAPVGAYQNPTSPAFLDTRWSFYDENQDVVSISNRDVLCHVQNLRYRYQQEVPTGPILSAKPLPCSLVCCTEPPTRGPFLQVTDAVRNSVLAQFQAHTPILLILQKVTLPRDFLGTLDVLSVHGTHEVSIGTLTVLHQSKHTDQHPPMTLVLDITEAAGDLLDKSHPASIQVRPREQPVPILRDFILSSTIAEIRTVGADSQ